uniref:Uncharacterized protein n=1 Tax=Nelumbo nucifera TaxID=4432 RepID=A0A822YVT8_NELNU|nr:TPA_asm: hypothetical protein HUJ06_007298 [Nelumbo nucifera]
MYEDAFGFPGYVFRLLSHFFLRFSVCFSFFLLC